MSRLVALVALTMVAFAANSVLNRMALAGTALSAGTALGTFTALNAAPWTTLYTPRSLTPTNTGKWSAIMIPAGYTVGIVTGGGTLPAAFSGLVTVRARTKPQ